MVLSIRVPNKKQSANSHQTTQPKKKKQQITQIYDIFNPIISSTKNYSIANSHFKQPPTNLSNTDDQYVLWVYVLSLLNDTKHLPFGQK